MTFDPLKYLQFLIAPCSQVVRGFVSIYVVNQYLGLTAVGIWAQVLACHAFMYMFINFNLTQSMSRFYPQYLKNSVNVYRVSSAVFLVNLAFILIYLLILFPVKDSILDFVYGSDALVGFLLLGFLFAVENLYNVIYCHYRSILNAKKQAFLALSRLSFEIIFFLLFVPFFSDQKSLDIYSFLLFYIIFVFVSIFVFIVIMRESKNIVISGLVVVDNWGQFLNYGLRLLPMSLAFWVISQADRWIITGKFDHETLGYYFIATRFFIIYSLLVSPFHSIYTYIASSHEHNLIGFYKVIRTATFVSLLFSLILYICHPFILFLFNMESEAYISVSNLVPYMLISGFLYAFYSILNTFRSINAPGLVSIEWVALSVLYLIFVLILPSYFGLRGFVFAQILSYMIVIISVLVRLKFNESI